MGEDVLNPRRAPRVPVRYTVELRHRYSSWIGETEDLGPAGCQIVTPRLLSRGRELRVSLRASGTDRVMDLDGHVVWTRPETPARIGVVFVAAPGGTAWFHDLLAADPVAARVVARTPERLPSTARLYLGSPPRQVPDDLGAAGLAILRAAAGGLTVAALSHALGSGFDRARGHLFSLVARRFVVLDAGSSVSPHRWRHVIGDVPHLRNERERATRLESRPPAQRLYDEGIAHLNAGRLNLAVQRFREALETEPGDEVLQGAVRRLGPWAG